MGPKCSIFQKINDVLIKIRHFKIRELQVNFVQDKIYLTINNICHTPTYIQKIALAPGNFHVFGSHHAYMLLFIAKVSVLEVLYFSQNNPLFSLLVLKVIINKRIATPII